MINMEKRIQTGLTIAQIDDLNERLGFINGQVGAIAALAETDGGFVNIGPDEVGQIARAAQHEVERVNTILSNAEEETKKAARGLGS